MNKTELAKQLVKIAEELTAEARHVVLYVSGEGDTEMTLSAIEKLAHFAGMVGSVTGGPDQGGYNIIVGKGLTKKELLQLQVDELGLKDESEMEDMQNSISFF